MSGQNLDHTAENGMTGDEASSGIAPTEVDASSNQDVLTPQHPVQEQRDLAGSRSRDAAGQATNDGDGAARTELDRYPANRVLAGPNPDRKNKNTNSNDGFPVAADPEESHQ